MTDTTDKTIKYYDMNSESFRSDTAGADMHQMQDWFLSFLPEHASVLDLGCGSGRDSLYFLRRGMSVTAADGSAEMCRTASETTGLEVRQMLFSELDYENAFDGIWACASLLHVPSDELTEVFQKVVRALRPGGTLYVSFKCGTFEGDRNGRYYTYLNEDSLAAYFDRIPGTAILETRITSDVRPGRADEKWLNAVIGENNK